MMDYVFIALIIIIIVVSIIFYNRFVSFKNRVGEAWSGIDIQLKRRYDLVPNLLENLKRYASHEKELFENLAKYRLMGIEANNMNDQTKAENLLSGEIRHLYMVAENYPELKSSNNFIEFNNSLEEIEENIEKARRYYNAIVRDNNISIESFPGVLYAKLFKFNAFDYFDIEKGIERQNVKI